MLERPPRPFVIRQVILLSMPTPQPDRRGMPHRGIRLPAESCLIGWLVIGQLMPADLAHVVRRPRRSAAKGVTPALSPEEAMAPLCRHGCFSIVPGLWDRAIIAAMAYTLARAGAVVALTVEDYSRERGARGRGYAKNTVSWRNALLPISTRSRIGRCCMVMSCMSCASCAAVLLLI
jgi:hypothetical protein